MRIPPKSLVACAKPSMMSSELGECAHRDARAQIGPQPVPNFKQFFAIATAPVCRLRINFNKHL
jgi:hypothetical protein